MFILKDIQMAEAHTKLSKLHRDSIQKLNLALYNSILIKNNIECRPIVAGNFTKNPVIKFLDYEICGDLAVSDEIHQNGFFVGNDFRDLSNEINWLHGLIKDFEQNIL